MTQIATNRKNEQRLAAAIASVKIDRDFNFCKVASTSSDATYFVDFNGESLFAEKCTCIGNATFHAYCIHCQAVDAVLDTEREARWQASQLDCATSEVYSIAMAEADADTATRIAEKEDIESAAVAGDKSYASAYDFTRPVVATPAQELCCKCNEPLKGSKIVCGACIGW